MSLLKSLLKHIDLLNCCLLWVIFILTFYRTPTFELLAFSRIYLAFGLVPLIYGLLRVRHFRKGTKNAVLSIVNIISLPVYGIIVLICIATQYA